MIFVIIMIIINVFNVLLVKIITFISIYEVMIYDPFVLIMFIIFGDVIFILILLNDCISITYGLVSLVFGLLSPLVSFFNT